MIIQGYDPLPLLITSGTLAAAGTSNMDKAAVAGYRRVVGSVYSTAACAAGFPRVRQSMDGTNWDIISVASVDATQTVFLYNIDVPIVAPYVSVEITDAGAGSTFRAAVYAVFDPASAGSSNVNPNAPTWSTVPTYHSVFPGLAAPIGQFFELVGTAGTVARVKEISIYKPSVPIELKAIIQSVASTGGTSATVVTKLDLNNAAAASTSKQYTVAPTPGSSSGNVIDVKTVTAGDIVSWTFGDNWDQPLVIRAGQSLALSTDVAFTAYGYVRWAEATS